MKPKLTYLPLEAYKSRYTELLSSPTGWFQTQMAKTFEINRIEPNVAPVTTIQNGSVLDSVNRPIWAMGQTAALLQSTANGLVYFDDFFHPGLEALPYTGRDYSAFGFCWAQSFDRYDFTRAMANWMRAYEAMAFGIYRRVFVASPLLADFITTVFPECEEQVKVVGLPFNSQDVAGRFDPSFTANYDVVFASRFDKERHPGFFLDVVERMPNNSFAICTGHEELRGNDYAAIARANALIAKGRLSLHAGLTKPEYYSILKGSSVQFNCSLQDWVSFTLLEALTYKCAPCYPAKRDFPIVFEGAPGFLYNPNSVDDACGLIHTLVVNGISKEDRAELNKIVAYHDGTFERITKEILDAR